MHASILELKPEPNDLVVIPHGMELMDNPPFMVHQVKHLHKPSIIRSGGSSMGFLSQDSSVTGTGSFRDWIKQFVGSGFEMFGSPLDAYVHSDSPYRDLLGEPISSGKGQFIAEEKEDLPKFFRYSRLLQPLANLDSDTVDWGLSAKGGVGFLIELDAEHSTFAFSYALCNEYDNFDRNIARAILNQRFDSEDWYEVKNYDDTLSVVDNIKKAIELLLIDKKDGTIPSAETSIEFSSLSERMDLRELKQIYERI